MPVAPKVQISKSQEASLPYPSSQPSSQTPSSSPPLQNLAGRCFGKFKVLKYSFAHDKRPTPDGLSAQPVDPFEWSHRTEAGIMLRIYRVEPEISLSGENLPIARIVVTKGFGRSPTIMEEITLPLLHSVFLHIPNVGNNVFACIARDPVMGFRYLVKQNSELMTFRFQIRLEDSSQYERALNLLQKLNCPLTILQSKKPSEPSSESSSLPPTESSTVGRTTETQQQIASTNVSQSSTEKINPDFIVHEPDPPRLRFAATRNSLLYQTQISSYDSGLSQSTLVAPNSSSNYLSPLFSQLQGSLGKSGSAAPSVASILPHVVGYESQQDSQDTTATVASVSLESLQPHQTMVEGSSSESQVAVKFLAQDTLVRPKLRPAHQNRVVIGGSLFSLVPIEDSIQHPIVNSPLDLDNNAGSAVFIGDSPVRAVESNPVAPVASVSVSALPSAPNQGSVLVPNSVSPCNSAVISAPSVAPASEENSRAASPQLSYESNTQNKTSVHDDSTTLSSQTPSISSLIHSVLSNRGELVQRPGLQIQQRIRQIINEPDFWRLVHDIEKQWHTLTKGI